MGYYDDTRIYSGSWGIMNKCFFAIGSSSFKTNDTDMSHFSEILFRLFKIKTYKCMFSKLGVPEVSKALMDFGVVKFTRLRIYISTSHTQGEQVNIG